MMMTSRRKRMRLLFRQICKHKLRMNKDFNLNHVVRLVEAWYGRQARVNFRFRES